MTTKVRSFRRKRLTAEEGREAAARVVAMPVAEREEKLGQLSLDDPETLHALLDGLLQQKYAAPAKVLEEATFVYRFLEKVEPRYPADPLMFDEREYFLGELARLAGGCCLDLGRREEARLWFDFAEGWYLFAENPAGNVFKLVYQRLTLMVEEREFARVLERLPWLVESFERLDMPEDALKSRLLEAIVLKEMGSLPEALKGLHKVAEEARALGSETLLASALTNACRVYCFLGQAEEAMLIAREATPLLQRLGNQIFLAKLQWGMGYLLRKRGDLSGAIEAYRVAQTAFAELGMRADVAAVHLVLADLLLDVGQDAQARWEIQVALPVIDELKLVPEGVAALSLLRQSLKNQRIDRKALRELHGYFPDRES